MNYFDEKCWDNADNVNSFDIEKVADAPTESHLEHDMLPHPLTFDELITAQGADDYSTTAIIWQSDVDDGAFFEDTGSMLKRKHLDDTGTLHTVVPVFLRLKLLTLMQYVILSGHPGQNKTY